MIKILFNERAVAEAQVNTFQWLLTKISIMYGYPRNIMQW